MYQTSGRALHSGSFSGEMEVEVDADPDSRQAGGGGPDRELEEGGEASPLNGETPPNTPPAAPFTSHAPQTPV